MNAHLRILIRVVSWALLWTFVWMPARGSASNYSLFSVRVDRWTPFAQSRPLYGTDYTVDGARLGIPPASALPVTPSGDCPAAPADTPCTGSWGTGPPGSGTSRSGGLIALLGADGQNSVWIPSYAVVSLMSTNVVSSNNHFPGYPTATRYYSYWNQAGVFYPSNPYGAIATTTIYAAATTTLSSGYYDDPPRPGHIRIQPGANRFGGTMRFFSGDGYFFVGRAERPSSSLFAAYRWNAIRTQSNHGNPPMRNAMTGPQTLGQNLTYGSTRMEHSTLQTSGGLPVTYQFWAFSTIVPWTTGMVTVDQPYGPLSTRIVQTGYDTRSTTTYGAVTGRLSLVQPYLYHNYPSVGTTGSVTHLAFMRRVTLTFNPEPAAAGLLIAGILGLVGLYRLRGY